MKNRQITLAARPVGLPKESDFRLVETEAPSPGEGEIRVRTHYVSVDPYLRGLVGSGSGYAEAIPLGAVVPGGAVGTVEESRHPAFKPGDVAVGYWGWQDFAAVAGGQVEKVDTTLGPISTSLGVLGMPGMTAYFGLLEVGEVKGGENVFVSGAAGAVGSLVGQIARVLGCRVVGSAGSTEKVRHLKEDLGFHDAFNYKEVDDYNVRLRELFPEGVQVYFDNVGGAITDAVFRNLALGARMVICGQIDQYNATEPPQGPRLLFQLIARQARAEGFLVFRFRDRYHEARPRIAQWIREGKITYRETVTDGLENTPRAFIGLFKGENIGKQIVRVSPE